jgi:AbrB family looped-hinge helix DNA binding protein
MTEKHQITIPKKITDILGLGRGSIFNVEIHEHRIELIPLEPVEKVFTDEQYQKLDSLCQKEKGMEKKVTPSFIAKLKQGKT